MGCCGFEERNEKPFPRCIGLAKEKDVTSIPALFGRSISKGAAICLADVDWGMLLSSIGASRSDGRGALSMSVRCNSSSSSSSYWAGCREGSGGFGEGALISSIVV